MYFDSQDFIVDLTDRRKFCEDKENSRNTFQFMY